MSLLTASNSPRFRFTLNSDLLGPRVLATDPTGWNSLGVNLTRDPKTHGLSVAYTVQLGFVKDGRAYLARAYAAAGIEADVRLLVEQLDPNTFSWLPYYAGRVNLTSAEFSRLTVKANVENQDFTQKFLNRDTVAVDLFGTTTVGGSVAPAAPVTSVALHSRTIIKRFDGSVLPAAPALELGPGLVFDDFSRSQTFYFGYSTIASNEIGLQQIAGGFVSGDAYSAVPIFVSPDSGQYVVEFGGLVDIQVQTTAASVGPQGTFEKVDVKFHYRLNGDPTTAVVLDSQAGSVGEGGRAGWYKHRFTIAPTTYTHQLKPGDKIFLYAEVYVHEITGTGGGYLFNVKAVEQPGTYLRIGAQTQTAPTPCAGLLLYEALDRMCQALTDTPDAFRSTYFGRTDCRRPQGTDGPGALTMLTGGFQVRGFPLLSDPPPLAPATDARKSLFATWRELWDSISAIYGLGWAVESAGGQSWIRVEPLAYWYPATVVLDLTLDTPERPAGAADVTTKVLTDRHFQRLEFGYTAWQAEQVNGLDEANTKRQWTTPLTQVSGTYSQLSKYSTSGQLLEVTRRQRFVNSDTTDNRSDNNNFLVCLLRQPAQPTAFETERNQFFPVLSGVLDPASIYNARLTPSRNLRRHGAVVRAGLAHTTAPIRFTFGEGNNALVTRLTSETVEVAENSPIVLADLPAPLWRPESDTFTLPVTRAQLRALLAFPQGRIRYYDLQRTVREGWVLECKHDAVAQRAEFTLLPCAEILT